MRLTISISTGPAIGEPTSPEVRLLKPALLYADGVRLNSPAIGAITAITNRASDPKTAFETVKDFARITRPGLAEQFDEEVARLSGIERPTGAERRRIKALRALRETTRVELLAAADALYRQCGGDELDLAIRAGLLAIDPPMPDSETADQEIVRGLLNAALHREYEETLLPAYMSRLESILRDPRTYPLFDETVAGVIAEGAFNEVFDISATASRRSKQVSIASQLMEALPSFPAASVAEILDIRIDLQTPIVRFRAAVNEMERLVESESYSPEFPSEVEDIYIERVAPALAEIDERIGTDRYLRQLTGAIVGDAKPIAAAGLAIGVATGTGIGGLASAVIAAVFPAARATWTFLEENRETQRHQLFFLYKAKDLLK